MLKRIVVVLAVAILGLSAEGEARKPDVHPQESPTVAVATTPSGVRFVALGAVKRLRLEVLDGNSTSVFHSSFQGGNVYDWPLRDGSGVPLADGSYQSLLTVVAADGRMSVKQCSIVITAGAAALDLGGMDPVDPAGPLDLGQRSSDAAQAMTVTAHDGEVGQVVSTTDALSFRLGDLFSGKDEEGMRLTKSGLTVFGTIRAKGGLVFDDGTALTSSGAPGRVKADGTIEAHLAGTGTQNVLAKWIDGAGTLGDSAVTEVSGNVGIGVTVPMQRLHLFGKSLFQNTGTASLFIVDRTDGKIAALGAGGVSATLAYDNSGIFKIESNSRANIAAGVFGTIQGATTRLVVDASGNVGVGVETPLHRLHVAGNVNTTTDYRILGDRVLSVAASNTFVGVQAGADTTDGFGNSFFGTSAGSKNTGAENSFFGASAGFNNVSGSSNASFGFFAGQSSVSGDLNAFFGAYAGNATTGHSNTFVGGSAGGSNVSGSGNAALGTYADVGSGLVNATAIGYRALVTQSASLVLGSVAAVNGASGDTSVGIGTTAPQARLHVAKGPILAATNAGDAEAITVGQRWRDNSIVAWARVTAAGGADQSFGVTAVTRPNAVPSGVYIITISAAAAATSTLIPIATAEIDLPDRPTNSASMRVVAINQVGNNSFYVYMNDGNGTPVNNDFVFMVTAR